MNKKKARIFSETTEEVVFLFLRYPHVVNESVAIKKAGKPVNDRPDDVLSRARLDNIAVVDQILDFFLGSFSILL